MEGIIQPSPGEPIVVDSIGMCIYGMPGAGKTTSLGSLDNPLILYPDKNRLALQRIRKAYKLISSWDELVATRAEIASELYGKTFPYTAVCIDSASDTEHLLKQAIAPNKPFPFDKWKDLIPKWRDEFLAFLEFTNPDVYPQTVDIIITAKLKIQSSEADGRSWAYPMVPGNVLPGEMFGWFDEVFHMRTESAYKDNAEYTRHFFRTSSDDMYSAKDGSGVLDLEEDPDLAAIKDKIAKQLSAA